MRQALLALLALAACGGEPPPAPAPPPPPAPPAPSVIASAPPPAVVDAGPPPEPAFSLAITASPDHTLAVAEFAACAITTKREVACWGKGSDMEKYPADLVRSKTPKIIAGLEDVERISAGYRYACAVLKSGEVSCWGMLTAEEDKKGGAKPAKIAKLQDVLDVSVGRYEACARTKDGDVWCWGKIDDKLTMMPALMANGARFDAAAGSLCWLDKGGTAGCIGGPISGAHEALRSSGGAKQIELPPSREVAVEVGLACGITGAKKIACAGDLAATWTPLVAGVTDAKVLAIGSGHHFGCAITDSKTMCWGEHELGELGAKQSTKGRQSPAVELKLPEPAIDIALGNTGGCARTKANKIYCWGSGSWGMGGDEKTFAPVEVKLP